MPSLGASVGAARGQKVQGDRAKILHGTDLPMKCREVTIACNGLRAAPSDWSAKWIMDIVIVKPKLPAFGALALNTSNTRRLIELIGDNSDKAKNKQFVFLVGLVNNPSTGKMQRSLVLDRLAKGGKRK